MFLASLDANSRLTKNTCTRATVTCSPQMMGDQKLTRSLFLITAYQSLTDCWRAWWMKRVILREMLLMLATFSCTCAHHDLVYLGYHDLHSMIQCCVILSMCNNQSVRFLSTVLFIPIFATREGSLITLYLSTFKLTATAVVDTLNWFSSAWSAVILWRMNTCMNRYTSLPSLLALLSRHTECTPGTVTVWHPLFDCVLHTWQVSQGEGWLCHWLAWCVSNSPVGQCRLTWCVSNSPGVSLTHLVCQLDSPGVPV